MSFWTSIADAVGGVAPTVATALGGVVGGPLGAGLAGTATRALSHALLGKPDASEEEIQEALRTDPDALAKVRIAETELQAELARQGVKLEQVHSEDRQNARHHANLARQSGDNTARILAYLLVAGFLCVILAVLFAPINIEDKTLLGMLVGYLSAKADQVVSFFFGSSAGSKDKDKAMQKAVEGSMAGDQRLTPRATFEELTQ